MESHLQADVHADVSMAVRATGPASAQIVVGVTAPEPLDFRDPLMAQPSITVSARLRMGDDDVIPAAKVTLRARASQDPLGDLYAKPGDALIKVPSYSFPTGMCSLAFLEPVPGGRRERVVFDVHLDARSLACVHAQGHGVEVILGRLEVTNQPELGEFAESAEWNVCRPPTLAASARMLATATPTGVLVGLGPLQHRLEWQQWQEDEQGEYALTEYSLPVDLVESPVAGRCNHTVCLNQVAFLVDA